MGKVAFNPFVSLRFALSLSQFVVLSLILVFFFSRLRAVLSLPFQQLKRRGVERLTSFVLAARNNCKLKLITAGVMYLNYIQTFVYE